MRCNVRWSWWCLFGYSDVGTRWRSVHSDTTTCLSSTTSTTAGITREWTMISQVRRLGGLPGVATGVGAGTSASTGTATCGRLEWGRCSGRTTTTMRNRNSNCPSEYCSISAGSTERRRHRPTSPPAGSPSSRPAGRRLRRRRPTRRSPPTTPTNAGSGNSDDDGSAVDCWQDVADDSGYDDSDGDKNFEGELR